MNDKKSGNELSTSLPEAVRKAERLTRKETIDHLFAKLAALYGNKFADLWVGQDLAAVKATWSDAIADLTPDELRHGINVLITGGKAFPPTLPEFYAVCRPPLRVPPVTDHRGLDVLATRLGVSTSGCYSYDALRTKLLTAIDDGVREMPREQQTEARALPSRLAL